MTPISHPFFVLFFFNLSFYSYSQFHFSDQAQKAYNDYFKLKVNSANQAVKELQKYEDQKALVLYLENLSDILPILISDNKAEYEARKENEDLRLNTLKTFDKNSPYHLYIAAEIKLHWAMAKIAFNDNVQAFWNIRSAYKNISDNKDKYPDFLPNDKTLGLLQVILSAVPEEYQWITKSFGLRGNFEKGMRSLKKVAGKEGPFQMESKLYYLLINQFMGGGDEDHSMEDLTKLYTNNKDNLLIGFIYANVLFKKGRNDDALTVLKYAPQNANYIKFHFIDYLIGEAYLQKLQYNNAIIHYFKFIRNYKGRNFKRSAYLKVFFAYYLQGNETKAKEYLIQIPSIEGNATTPDHYATHFEKRAHFPPKELLKARLLTDGGYYQRALSMLEDYKTKKYSDRESRIEFTYRIGRLHHKLEQYDEGIKWYKHTIDLSTLNDPFYFAPNSCLQLGYIYNGREQKVQANDYLKRVFQYPNHPYKKELDQAAQMELEKTKKQ